MTHIRIHPAVAGLCMALSSVSVVLSSLQLRRYKAPELPHAPHLSPHLTPHAAAHAPGVAQGVESGEETGEEEVDLEGGEGAWKWRRSLWGRGAGSSVGIAMKLRSQVKSRSQGGGVAEAAYTKLLQ